MQITTKQNRLYQNYYNNLFILDLFYAGKIGSQSMVYQAKWKLKKIDSFLKKNLEKSRKNFVLACSLFYMDHHQLR